MIATAGSALSGLLRTLKQVTVDAPYTTVSVSPIPYSPGVDVAATPSDAPPVPVDVSGIMCLIETAIIDLTWLHLAMLKLNE